MRRVIVVGLVALACWWPASPAAAHVLLEQTTPRGDGSVELSFTFDHSCEGSPTTEMAIGLPAGAEAVEGVGPEGWTAEATGGEVVFSGPGIGDKSGERFTVVARLTGSVGETLLFPARQTCANGEGYEWDDASESEERPAPRLVATQATLADTATPTLPNEGASLLQVAVATAALALISFLAATFLLRSPSRR
ncbi:MAG: DUF1775 domain-containing protein [Aeromicrobium sp.]|uniref:DUF1775 domain-containing protein n=1 Tax=Aeromicrobium sp. TaxID=1871063 RepID=UPI0039E46AE2